MGPVYIRSWHPKINGSHFGLPPGAIQRMTGVGGKFMNYDVCAPAPFHCPQKLCVSIVSVYLPSYLFTFFVCHDQVASQQKRINELEEEYSRLMSRMENSLQRQQQMAEELKEMTALNELVLQLEEDNSRLQVRAKRGKSPNYC